MERSRPSSSETETETGQEESFPFAKHPTEWRMFRTLSFESVLSACTVPQRSIDILNVRISCNFGLFAPLTDTWNLLSCRGNTVSVPYLGVVIDCANARERPCIRSTLYRARGTPFRLGTLAHIPPHKKGRSHSTLSGDLVEYMYLTFSQMTPSRNIFSSCKSKVKIMFGFGVLFSLKFQASIIKE